ncbi:hypothetical protein BS47DRAFT_1379044 [Hydnum rufescens UP504]|uniref:Uncharacterized protein n=1 Tax=Hydnum rufescens UP504 TaxID=1448309 RepID=A0A9P6B9R4_9AGAM|nr:hypothetical protein BS47DRAFT_1379044 [Hydnum rufescens UP504]
MSPHRRRVAWGWDRSMICPYQIIFMYTWWIIGLIYPHSGQSGPKGRAPTKCIPTARPLGLVYQWLWIFSVIIPDRGGEKIQILCRLKKGGLAFTSRSAKVNISPYLVFTESSNHAIAFYATVAVPKTMWFPTKPRYGAGEDAGSRCTSINLILNWKQVFQAKPLTRLLFFSIPRWCGPKQGSERGEVWYLCSEPLIYNFGAVMLANAFVPPVVVRWEDMMGTEDTCARHQISEQPGAA